MQTLRKLSTDLAAGAIRSRDLVEECLARIADSSGEGVRAFLSIDAEGARATADHVDGLRARGVVPSPLAGIPVAVKDLFDVAGQVTTAGSRILREQPCARTDALIVQRLRAALMPILGRNNMTEFAFSGLGINPHYGTPANPFDRANRRIPGGSSSGAAVAVADGLAPVAVGTDTGGSCRIPAALCGVVGFKPTKERIPTDGAVPLSTTLDSIGPLGASVSCCAMLDAVLAGQPVADVRPLPARGLRLGVLQTTVLDGLDGPVAAAFTRALTRLSERGALLQDVIATAIERMGGMAAPGVFSTSEAYAWHRSHIDRAGEQYDPRVLSRIVQGRKILAAEYLDMRRTRREIIAEVTPSLHPFDAWIMPCTARIAPTIAELEGDDEAYFRANLAMLRNPAIANFLDLCAISLPCHDPGGAPVGLMLIGKHGHDRALFDVAAAIEAALGRVTP